MRRDALVGLVWTVVAAPAISSAEAPTQVSAPLSTTDVVWLEQPSIDQVCKAYPTKAQANAVKGLVGLRCVVSDQGSLQNCALLSESPVGEGFAAAAMTLVPAYRLSERTKAGEAVAGRSLSFNMRFQPNLIPTLNKVDASAREEGSAIIRCTVGSDYHLADCAVLSTIPARPSIGVAALKVAKYIKLNPPTDGKPMVGSSFQTKITFKIEP